MLCFWDGVPPPLSIGVGNSRFGGCEGVALPVLSEETPSEPTALGEAVPLSPAKLPADAAFPPDPPLTRQHPFGDTLGRSDTESLGPAEFQYGSHSCVLLCFSLGLWSLVRQISRPSRVTCGCSLVQASGLSPGLAFCIAFHAYCFFQSKSFACVCVGLGQDAVTSSCELYPCSHLLLLAFSW